MTDFAITIAPDEEGESAPPSGGPHVPVDMFRVYRHLLPDAHAWRLAPGSMIARFVEGLSRGAASSRAFLDGVITDRLARFTREIEEWEREFGLVGATTEEARRGQIAAAARAIGGQGKDYLEEVLHAAGFDVYVHEWWVPETEPREERDPRDYTEQPLIGTAQCRSTDAPNCCEEFGGPAETGKQPQCTRFLANYPRYFANKDLRGFPPPPIPSSSTAWRFFLYFGAETFGDDAELPAARKDEFERLIRKYSPGHLWLVTLVTYT